MKEEIKGLIGVYAILIVVWLLFLLGAGWKGNEPFFIFMGIAFLILPVIAYLGHDDNNMMT